MQSQSTEPTLTFPDVSHGYPAEPPPPLLRYRFALKMHSFAGSQAFEEVIKLSNAKGVVWC